MDLISTRTIDITKLAMDGLMQRQKAISANIANVMTPDYQRKEVSFEGQLKGIMEQEDLKTELKEQNSIQYNPTSLDMATGQNSISLTLQDKQFLQKDLYGNYQPQITADTMAGSDDTGNNVTLEQEVMDMSQTNLRYNTLATLEGKKLKEIAGAIKGDVAG